MCTGTLAWHTTMSPFLTTPCLGAAETEQPLLLLNDRRLLLQPDSYYARLVTGCLSTQEMRDPNGLCGEGTSGQAGDAEVAFAYVQVRYKRTVRERVGSGQAEEED